MRWLAGILAVWLAASTGAWAVEPVSRLVVDGVTYHDVRWGPVNQGKVQFFHNRGVAVVALEDLPREFQRKFGYHPESATASDHPPSQPLPSIGYSDPAGESAYDRLKRDQARRQQQADLAKQRTLDAQRTSNVVFQGRLVDKQSLVVLTGFLNTRAEWRDGEILTRGYLLDLARLRESARNTPAEMQMRPGLWERTGEQVFLKDHATDELPGDLVKVYGKEVAAIRDVRTFITGHEPTPEQYLQLRK